MVAKAIGRKFISVRADVKKNRLIHQARFIKSHAARAIGDQANVVDRAQLDQGNASTR